MKTVPSSTPVRLCLASAASLALLSCAASAQTYINIDFNITNPTPAYGTYTGAGPAPGAGTLWNGLSVGFENVLNASYTSPTLSNSTGTATPITISLGGFKSYEANENPSPFATSLMTNFLYQEVLGTGGPNATFSLNNLDATATYDLYFMAQNGGYRSAATIFTIDGISQTTTNTGPGMGSFILNGNYVVYTGLVPSPGGTISGTFNSAKVADNASWNGLQIVQHGAPPPPPANAANTIKVDFNSTIPLSGTYSGQAVAPQSGGLWNGAGVGAEAGNPLIGSFTSDPLQASDGSNTSVTFSLGNFRVYDAAEAPASLSLLTDFVYQPELGNTGPDSTFSLSGLNPSFTYDLYLYAQNGAYAGTQTSFTINGFTQIASNAGNIGSFVEGTNYVLFSGLSPDLLGTISGTFNCAKVADNAAFAGFELVAVPEPATTAFLATGTLLALARRRRR